MRLRIPDSRSLQSINSIGRRFPPLSTQVPHFIVALHRLLIWWWHSSPMYWLRILFLLYRRGDCMAFPNTYKSFPVSSEHSQECSISDLMIFNIYIYIWYNFNVLFSKLLNRLFICLFLFLLILFEKMCIWELINTASINLTKNFEKVFFYV